MLNRRVNELFTSIDEAFINSAYLSELWAVQDLLKLKNNYKLFWNAGREKQLQDEINHARILLDALKISSKTVITDLAYSMQERLYRKHFNLSLCHSVEQHALIHDMTESRAIWIYKTYMKINPNSKYNNIFRQILNDEQNHFNIDDSINQNSEFTKASLKAVDRLIFRAYLPEKYGARIFENEEFWNWYYLGA